MRAMLYPVDGEPVEINLRPGLEPLQELVGGDIEGFPVPHPDGSQWQGVTAYFNADGKFQRLPRNERGTELLKMEEQGAYEGDFVAGPLVITGITEEGEGTDLPENWSDDG